MLAAVVDISSVTGNGKCRSSSATAELDTAVGKNRLARESDIPNLKYLQAFSKKVFRLHPPAPLLIPHESTRGCQLAGYQVPAGTRLFVHAYAIGRSSKVWENPLDFNLERFMSRPEVDVRGQDFGLIPFGSGRRACPAITMVTVSVQWTTAMLVHAFDWSLPACESCKDLDMTKEFGITTPRANPFFLHAVPRLSIDLYSA